MITTQDQINEKIVAVSFKRMKLTAQALAKLLDTVVRKLQEDKAPQGKRGKPVAANFIGRSSGPGATASPRQ